jgi:hypothetical protein
MKDEIEGMTRGVVTVLENQIDAETNIQGNCRYIKIVATICCITTLSSLACGFFWHARVQELAESHAETTALKAEIATLETEIANTEWLWNSHNLNVSLLEDDPSHLTRDNGKVWEKFCQIATARRVEGFIAIVNDGCHPRLEAWHNGKETRSPNEEVSTLRIKLKETEKHLAISQSKLNATLAFIHDDPYYWDKVDPTHLSSKWGAGYAKRIEQAPRMKKHLGMDGESKQATAKIGEY